MSVFRRIKYRTVHVFHGWDGSMSDNTPFSGSAGPHLGKKRGFSAWITGAEQSAAIKTNLSSLTKAGQAFKKNILQHKGEDTAGCSVGVRELGDDGFTRYNIEGEAIFITKRSTDVFADDEFVDAGSEQFIGRRLSSAEEPKEAAEAVPEAKPSTFVPDIGRKPAPKTFKGMGYREAPAKAHFREVPAKQETVVKQEPAVEQAPAEVAVKPAPVKQAPVAEPVVEAPRHETAVPSNSAAIMGKVAKRVPRIESPIDWSDPDDSEDMFISQSESSVPEASGPEPAVVEAPVDKVEVGPIGEVEGLYTENDAVSDISVSVDVTESSEDVSDEGSRSCVGFVEEPLPEIPADESAPIASVEVAEIDDQVAEVPVVEVPIEETPAAEIPAADVPAEEIPAAVEAPEEPIAVVPSVDKVEAGPIGEVNGLYSEGDAASDFSVSAGKAVDDVATANTSSAAEAPRDLTGYGINGVTDPQVARPRPRYRTYKFSGGRICDSASVEGKKEEPQRPLD